MPVDPFNVIVTASVNTAVAQPVSFGPYALNVIVAPATGLTSPVTVAWSDSEPPSATGGEAFVVMFGAALRTVTIPEPWPALRFPALDCAVASPTCAVCTPAIAGRMSSVGILRTSYVNAIVQPSPGLGRTTWPPVGGSKRYFPNSSPGTFTTVNSVPTHVPELPVAAGSIRRTSGSTPDGGGPTAGSCRWGTAAA